MGPTLFRYIFKDLMKVFLLAAVGIAGIMSFAGLLRPLSERGLDGQQVLRMLAWLLPAMATYSLPIAGLFATTFVYGRLAADNESTAIRAAGITTGPFSFTGWHFGITFPAVMLGLGTCGVSLGLLCFIVPAANLQVERVVYSNLARLSANEINRSKRLEFRSMAGGGMTITAESASVLDPSTLPETPRLTADTQIVQLHNVYVLRYTNVSEEGPRYDVPQEIYSARRATAFIEPPGYFTEGEVFETALRDDRFLLTVLLEDGLKFPRTYTQTGQSSLVAAVRASQVGPLALGSPLRENTKFLDIRELHRLYEHPELSREVGAFVQRLVDQEQRQTFLAQLRNEAAADGAIFASSEGHFTLTTQQVVGLLGDMQLNLSLEAEPGQIRLVQEREGETLTVEAPRARVTAEPLETPQGPQMLVVFTFEDADVTIDPAVGEPETTTGRAFERRALVPMPERIAAIADKTAAEFVAETTVGDVSAEALQQILLRQQNSVEAEIWARISFAFSCLVLPVVGGALGMLFKSGNFLTAFACSVVPAMLSIVLIVTGQHIAERLPEQIGNEWTNPLLLGLPLIWAGNVAVTIAGIILLWRLGRS